MDKIKMLLDRIDCNVLDREMLLEVLREKDRHCESCIHWQEEKKHSLRQGWCLSEKLHDDGVESADELSYSYSEGGGFLTGPKFGCVHHEKDKVDG